MRIATTHPAVLASRNLSRSYADSTAVSGRLSSGARIRHAADDAAGLALANRLRADTRSLQAAVRNASSATAILQIAEGATVSIVGILDRAKQLAVQAASDTVGDASRAALQEEFAQLQAEITRLTDTTRYRGTLLLKSTDSASGGSDTGGGGLLDPLTGLLLGGSTTTSGTSTTTAYAGIFQIGSTSGSESQLTIALGDLSLASLGLDAATLGSADQARAALAAVDGASAKVHSVGTAIGVAENRLTYVEGNLAAQIQSVLASESAIRDADMAREVLGLTRARLRAEVGTAVLAQANQSVERVVQLLQARTH